jgi:hypothetical protein
MVGDTHGDARDVKTAVDHARDFQTDRIFILGDFGLWWGYEGVAFIDNINEYARSKNVHIFALPGNHENYDWWNATIRTAPTSKGFAYLRTNVLLSPRTHTWKWGDKKFAVAGGAVSIDKDYRVEYERKKGTPIWSPDEQLTDAEVASFVGKGPVDYLLTHDCSNRTPFYARMKPDLDSQIHRQRIDKVLDHLTPNMHFHGHMHNKFDWVNWTGPERETLTQTYGLECNGTWWSWGVLDTDKDEFLFRGESNEETARYDSLGLVD